ncbi:MAG TPA: carbohydrate-binding protein [Jatrophihabitans sp.]|nr:carbohydrate-binding protein [Jatrophihabitans sp.]
MRLITKITTGLIAATALVSVSLSPAEANTSFYGNGTIEAETYTNQHGTGIGTNPGALASRYVGWINNGDWLEYDNVNFASPVSKISIQYASPVAQNPAGYIDVHVDSITASPVAHIIVNHTGSNWMSYLYFQNIPLNQSISGYHNIYLTFGSTVTSADFINVDLFAFGS